MQKNTPLKEGFSLVEAMVVIAIFVVVSAAVWTFYVYYYQVFHAQQALVSVAGSASATANELQRTVLQADQIMANYNFSGTIYNTDSDTLVLEIPSVDNSDNIIGGKYDYAVFYATSTHFYKLTQADGQSARLSGLRQLSDTISTLTFTYNNMDLAQANKIDVDIQTQTVANRQTVSYQLHQTLYLRNR